MQLPALRASPFDVVSHQNNHSPNKTNTGKLPKFHQILRKNFSLSLKIHLSQHSINQSSSLSIWSFFFHSLHITLLLTYSKMSAEEEHTFETADAGSSTTYPMQCSALRKNGFVVIKGRPCKIVDMSTSKTGKHGHAKVHLVAIDIFTQKKLEDLSPSTHNMEVPFVTRTEFQLLDIDDGFLNLMTPDGETKDDVKAPDGDIGDKLQTDFDDGKDLLVTIISAMGEEACISYKEAPKGN